MTCFCWSTKSKVKTDMVDYESSMKVAYCSHINGTLTALVSMKVKVWLLGVCARCCLPVQYCLMRAERLILGHNSTYSVCLFCSCDGRWRKCEKEEKEEEAPQGIGWSGWSTVQDRLPAQVVRGDPTSGHITVATFAEGSQSFFSHGEQ